MTRGEALKLDNSKLDSVVKIQGTNYDRKRKVTKQMAYRMKQMFNAGKSYATIAEHFGVEPKTVRYNIDESYRRWYLDNNPGGHTPAKTSVADRIAYKKELLQNRRPVVING